MRIVDPPLLASFRGHGRCSWCGCATSARQAAHVYAKGMGGASRLDHPWNLVSLCYVCHDAHHRGERPLRVDLLAVVAAREGLQQGEIRAELLRLIRLPGDPGLRRPRGKRRRRVPRCR